MRNRIFLFYVILNFLLYYLATSGQLINLNSTSIDIHVEWLKYLKRIFLRKLRKEIINEFAFYSCVIVQ